MASIKDMTSDQLREWLTGSGEALNRLEGVSEWDPSALSRGFDATKDLEEDPRRRSQKALGNVKSESKKLLSQARKAEKTGEKLGYDTTALKTSLVESKQGKEKSPSALDKYLLTPLDTPGRVLRAATTPGGDWFDWETAKDPKEWNKRISQQAKRGHPGALLQEGIKGAIGNTAGSLVGAGMAAPGVITDTIKGRSGTSIAREATKTFKEGQKATGEFGLTALTDPLAFLPVGKGAKLAGKAALTLADKVPLARRAGQALIGAGDLPLATAFAKRAEFADIARKSRGVKDVLTDKYIARDLAGRGTSKGMGPAVGINSVDDAENVIRRSELKAASYSSRAAKKAFIKAANVASLDDLPPAAKSALDRATNPTFQTLSKWLSSESINMPVLAGVARLYEKGVAAIKTNVLSRSPAHHAVNVFNDSLQAFMGGLDNPARLGQVADVLYGNGKIAVGQTVLDGKSLRTIMTKEGLIGGGLERMGFIGEEGRRAAAKNLARKAGVPVSADKKALMKDVLTGGIADYAPGALPVNAKFGEHWTDLIRGALFVDRLKKGDSVNQAARHTLAYLLDYRDNNKVLQMARWIVPFVNWYMKAPAMVGRAILEHPSRVINPERLAKALSGEERVEAPEFRTKQGTVIPLSERGEDIMSTFRGAPAEGQTYIRSRLPATEAAAAPMEFLQGNVMPLAEQFGPGPQAILAALGKDPITGAEIPSGAWEGVKYGLSTAVPSALMSRPMQSLVANPLLSSLIGEGAPVRPLSPFRGPSYDPKLDRSRDILGTLGLSTFVAKPEDRPRERLKELREIVEPSVGRLKKAEKVKKTKDKRRKD